MRALTALNLAVGVLLAAVMVVFQKTESSLLLLADAGLSLAFLLLAAANVVAVFALWRKHRLAALIPIGSFAVTGVVCFFGARFGSEIVLRDSLDRPASFFRELTR